LLSYSGNHEFDCPKIREVIYDLVRMQLVDRTLFVASYTIFIAIVNNVLAAINSSIEIFF
jgi:hypothetical protein